MTFRNLNKKAHLDHGEVSRILRTQKVFCDASEIQFDTHLGREYRLKWGNTPSEFTPHQLSRKCSRIGPLRPVGVLLLQKTSAARQLFTGGLFKWN